MDWKGTSPDTLSSCYLNRNRVFEFDLRFKIHGWDDRGGNGTKRSSTYTCYYNFKEEMFALEQRFETFAIRDIPSAKHNIIVINLVKDSISISLSSIDSSGSCDKQWNELPNHELSKLILTGDTQTMQGYLCEEYIQTIDGHNTNYWISVDPLWPGYNKSKTIEALEIGSNSTTKIGFGYPLLIINPIKGEKGEMRITDININENMKIDLSQYKFRQKYSTKKVRLAKANRTQS